MPSAFFAEHASIIVQKVLSNIRSVRGSKSQSDPETAMEWQDLQCDRPMPGPRPIATAPKPN